MAPQETPEEQKPQNIDQAPTESTPPDEASPGAPPVETAETPAVAPSGNKFKRLLTKLKNNKKVSIPLAILLVIAIMMAIPFTRYKVLGLVWKQTVAIHVKDSQTGKPISEASINIAGKTAVTGSDGMANVQSVPVGQHNAEVTKKYYTDTKTKILVPLRKSKASFDVQLKATGRQVPVVVNNRISGKPVENVLINAGDSQARTDKEGKVIVVVPADQTEVKVTLVADGYNSADAALKVTEQADVANTFQVTPAGKVYFLSKQSGKVDVVKTNLDGTARQVVLAGTGKEETTDTILLASRDWKFLALKSKRDGGANAKLFLIDTSNDKLTTMDEGDANFTLNGWSNHDFVYHVNRNNVTAWQPKRQALKGFNADKKQIAVLDETQAAGVNDYSSAYENIDNIYVLEDRVVYSKVWSQYNNLQEQDTRTSRIMSVSPNGQNKKSLKDFPSTIDVHVSGMNAKLYEPNEIYFQVYYTGKNTNDFYEYEDGKVGNANTNSETFNKFYPTYILSPSGKQNFWYEPRDGKNTLFVGNQDAKDEKQVATLSEYIPYGWYSDSYLFVSKNSSELYILPASGTKDGGQVVKVTDYHKPFADFTGYGGGYGGF
jgi:hypothetical protein